jgi:putative phosphoserine phosphatase / 1-acylglycerol-3-phosphate O-acyltransferase
MTSAADAIEQVRRGPKGPQVGAFFDLDGTLVRGYTAAAFYSDRVGGGQVSSGEFLRILLSALDTGLGGDPTKFADAAFMGLRGRTEDTLTELGERLFVQKVSGTMRPEARDLVRAHRRMGHTVAVASSASKYQIEPVARDLGIEHILCTCVEVEDGILTGRLARPMLWGEPKAAAVREFARANNIDRRASYAYANGAEDVPFLASVGNPSALNPHPGLAAAARSQGWPVLTLREPRQPGLRALLGTAAAMAAFNTGMGLGFAIGTLRRDPELGLNAAIPLACDGALALAGVRLNVVGESNLWASRPAVFVGNHQSSLDVLIVGSLVRRDLTGVAKKEAKYDPRMIVGGQLMDLAFIDRSNPESARRDVNALVDRIRSGTSVAIMPEGTRTPTPTVGRFKKGAFHLAMQAGVPMVPIVIRNAGELMWRRSMVINPGTVDVAVLEPIPAGHWTVEDLDARVAEVRQLFVDTLDNWPASGEVS